MRDQGIMDPETRTFRHQIQGAPHPGLHQPRPTHTQFPSGDSARTRTRQGRAEEERTTPFPPHTSREEMSEAAAVKREEGVHARMHV